MAESVPSPLRRADRTPRDGGLKESQMPPTPPANMSSKILGLKFMQRQAQKQQSAPAEDAKPAAAAAALPSSAQWTMPGHTTTASGMGSTTRVLSDDAVAAPSGRAALLQFRPGRRSFGGKNQRLEKRLGELVEEKRAARAEIAAEAVEAAAQRARDAERAALQARADASEAVEREDAVSDDEMASHYAKYAKFVKAPTPAVEPPVVSNPVRIRDAPQAPPGKRSIGRGGGGVPLPATKKTKRY